jgi:hypothetical protein
MRTVRSFANEAREAERYATKLDKVVSVQFRAATAYVGYLIINGVVIIIYYFVIIYDYSNRVSKHFSLLWHYGTADI